MQSVLTRLGRAHDVVTDIGGHVGKACLVLIVFAYCYEVVARYFFASPTWWANEMVSYALCIGCFLLMPEVTRASGHVAVTVLIERATPQQSARFLRFVNAGAFLVCAVATWINLDENIRQVVEDVHLMKVKPIPQIYISAWITYGFASSALYFLRAACSVAEGAEVHSGAQL